MSNKLPEIRFSNNWNNCLNSNIFCTIRFDEIHYKEGDRINVILRQHGVFKNIGIAHVLSIYKDVHFRAVQGFIPILTGYCEQQSLKLFENFNCNKPIENDTKINFIILKWEISKDYPDVQI